MVLSQVLMQPPLSLGSHYTRARACERQRLWELLRNPDARAELEQEFERMKCFLIAPVPAVLANCQHMSWVILKIIV